MFLSNWHDDLYYAQAAHHILHGEWLGPYSQMTVIKAPFYAFFLVFSSFTGLPLLLNETAFFALACLVLFFALKPWIKNPWWRLLLFGLLLYCPPSLNNEWTLRVYREFVYLSLSLFVVAFAIGFLLRLEGKLSKLITWSIGLGISMGAFMITREEGIWIYPMLFLFMLFCIIYIFKKKLGRKVLRCFSVILPVLLWYIPVLVVSILNFSHYGYWGISETLDNDFNRVLNTLQRVDTEIRHPYQSVSEDVLQKAGEVSPLFAELLPSIDQYKTEWQKSSNEAVLIKPQWYLDQYFDPSNADIGNTHFFWMLRDAMQAAGKYSSGKYPVEYINAMEDQLENACDQGLLNCKTAINIPRIGSISQEQSPLTPRFFVDDLYRMLTLDGVAVKMIPFDMSSWTYYRSEFVYYEEFVNNPIDSHLMGEEMADSRMIDSHRDARFNWLLIKSGILKNIRALYKFIYLPLAILTVLAWLCLLVLRLARKDLNISPLPLASTLFVFGLFISRLAVLAILDATTNIPAFYYSNTCHIFLIVFIMLSLWTLLTQPFFKKKVGAQKNTSEKLPG